MEILNNREIAILIWIFIGLVYIAISPKQKKLRQHLPALFEASIAKPLIRLYACIMIYVSLEILVLYKFGLWELNQTKSTFIWLIVIAIFSCFHVFRAEDTPKFFLKVLWSGVSLVAVLKYIVNIYPFGLIIEVLLLPVYQILLLVYVLADRKEKTNYISQSILLIFFFAGTALVIRACYMALLSITQNQPELLVNNFITPPLLTICFLPFLFVLLLFEVYRRAFLKVNLQFESGFKIGLAKTLAVFLFNFRFDLAERWANHLMQVNAKSYSEIIKSFLTIFMMRCSECYPKLHSTEKGWSAYLVKNHLETTGLKTGHYHPSFDDWFASSPMMEIGEGILANNIAYYVEGIKDYANVLKLKLNVNNPKTTKNALDEMLKQSTQLYESLFNKQIPHNIQHSILANKDDRFEEEDAIIFLSKNTWENNRNNGFDYNFTVKHKSII